MRWLALVLSLLVAAPAWSAEVWPSASRRFAGKTDEVPSFQRHVVPLLGRLGCNGRACHGSFQGQGGFRLSLSHKGGKRLEVGSWQYHLLLRWVQAGAPAVKEGDPTFVSLEVQPTEIVFRKPGESAQLTAIARWSDGVREDVTALCRFRTNDESVAVVDDAGRITATGKGDTHVVAFYDNGVAPVQVMLPVSERTGPNYPAVPAPTRIDELVVAKLRKLGIVPSELCSDDEFLRRLSLDLTGTLPSAAEVAGFLADTAPDKREKKIDELLERPAYAAWWATRLCDFTGNSERTGPLGGEQALNRDKARQWYLWIERRLRENRPYDQLVEGLVLAIGRGPQQSYEDYCREMSGYFRQKDPADFAARATMPYFWTRRTVGRSEDKALSFAHAFLGVSLQCAQCHKHPYDQWTKQDFDQFAAFFNGVRYGGGERAQVEAMKKAAGLGGLDEDSGNYKRKFADLVARGMVLPFKDLTVPPPPKGGKSARPTARFGRVITPRLLGGEEVIAANYHDPRQPLMDWLRQPDNPYFARALVNRVWSVYFHAGIIEPTDDHNLANPPSNPALLDWLADEFVAHGYDLKWLHRTIAASHTYQRSWRANDTNRHDERNFSRAVIRRLPAEAAYDAVVLATASDEARSLLEQDPACRRAIGAASCFAAPRDGSSYAVSLFGKPPRAINCDCERSNEPTLLQTVYLRNDPEVYRLIDRPDGWLKQVARSPQRDLDELVRQAYLRTLSRLPDARESAAARQHLHQAADPVSGLRDLLWALLNTKEFIVNR